MKKSELKTGDVVQMSDGEKYIVLKDCRTILYGLQKIVFVSPKGGFVIGEYYDENLNFIHGAASFNLKFVKSNFVSGDFFYSVKDKIQSNQKRNFKLQNDKFDLCMETEEFGNELIKIKISSIRTGKVLYQETKEWTSQEDIEVIFNDWIYEVEEIKKERYLDAQNALVEISSSSKGISSIKVCMLTQKLKKIYLLSDEEHEKILGDIKSEPIHFINVFQEYISRVPFHLD